MVTGRSRHQVAVTSDTALALARAPTGTRAADPGTDSEQESQLPSVPAAEHSPSQHTQQSQPRRGKRGGGSRASATSAGRGRVVASGTEPSSEQRDLSPIDEGSGSESHDPPPKQRAGRGRAAAVGSSQPVHRSTRSRT
ncbi:hypothetical protein CERSUDRAFT_101370 [Gelatoporia subvermispora B]|uniref:Uncharacterized protein n=1 Tax=Ceriporiopsis subvermispora (strain B) TaxID=914234 RepID=M2Q0V5_CERS8|nr:hypothetical protein CERSUDRAFT_101370 [Gelatoporia subvermispora B]